MLTHSRYSVIKKSFFILLFLVAGCATERPSGKTEAEVLFKEAQSLMEDHRYLLATEKLNTLRQHYPYSFYATHAELMQADILYNQENFVEAAAAYILFKDFHPKHPKLSYVLLRIAESFYFQLPDTFDRDLSPGHEAIKYYQELIRLFKTSKHAEMARKKIIEINNLIKSKEKYIADFYFKTEVWDSARYRYLSIIKNFRSKDLLDHSMIRVVRASGMMNRYSECNRFYKQYKNRISVEKRNQLENAYKVCKNL